MPDALAIFAKNPVPGSVKTRLVPPLSFAEAATLSLCMLRDTIAKARELPGITPYLFHAGGEGNGSAFAPYARGVHCVPQEGQDLGERLIRAFDRLFAAGHDRVAIIGSDSPHLPATHMNEAFELLASCDVVFGPSRDGGYYLVALNRPRPELFRDVPWSTDAVLARSLEIAAGADIRTALLPEWCDVDTVADLKRPELLAPDNGADLTRSFLVHRMGLCAEETDAGSARQDG